MDKALLKRGHLLVTDNCRWVQFLEPIDEEEYLADTGYGAIKTRYNDKDVHIIVGLMGYGFQSDNDRANYPKIWTLGDKTVSQPGADVFYMDDNKVSSIREIQDKFNLFHLIPSESNK